MAEFTFIHRRGGSEPARQDKLFVDLFNLATAETDKPRVLYVVGKDRPMRFLGNRRALTSVLSKGGPAARFRKPYGDRFETVGDYYRTVRDTVNIVDLRDFVPALRGPASLLLG